MPEDGSYEVVEAKGRPRYCVAWVVGGVPVKYFARCKYLFDANCIATAMNGYGLNWRLMVGEPTSRLGRP